MVIEQLQSQLSWPRLNLQEAAYIALLGHQLAGRLEHNQHVGTYELVPCLTDLHVCILLLVFAALTTATLSGFITVSCTGVFRCCTQPQITVEVKVNKKGCTYKAAQVANAVFQTLPTIIICD